MTKPKLLFDAKVIFDAFGNKNSSRSGVYFVIYNVLRELQKQGNFEITLCYFNENSKVLAEISKDDFFGKFQMINFGYSNKIVYLNGLIEQQQNQMLQTKNIIKKGIIALKIAKKILKKIIHSVLDLRIKRNLPEKLKYYSIFLEPFYAIPPIVKKQKHIKCFHILYDAIPLILDGYQSTNMMYREVVKTLNKDTYYFCISQSCKNDFFRIKSDVLDKDKMTVTYIASKEQFIPLDLTPPPRKQEKSCGNFIKVQSISRCKK